MITRRSRRICYQNTALLGYPWLCFDIKPGHPHCAMFSRLVTKQVRCRADIKSLFDELGRGYSEQHGHAERLLSYRIDLIKESAQFRSDDVVLDIGCGISHHLMVLAGEIGHGIGIDFFSAILKTPLLHVQHSKSVSKQKHTNGPLCSNAEYA